MLEEYDAAIDPVERRPAEVQKMLDRFVEHTRDNNAVTLCHPELTFSYRSERRMLAAGKRVVKVKGNTQYMPLPRWATTGPLNNLGFVVVWLPDYSHLSSVDRAGKPQGTRIWHAAVYPVRTTPEEAARMSEANYTSTEDSGEPPEGSRWQAFNNYPGKLPYDV